MDISQENWTEDIYRCPNCQRIMKACNVGDSKVCILCHKYFHVSQTELHTEALNQCTRGCRTPGQQFKRSFSKSHKLKKNDKQTL